MAEHKSSNMANTNGLRTLLLIMIRQNPNNGFDIAKKITAGMLWQTSSQMIYNYLHDLETNGYLTHVVEMQDRKPPKKIYSITSKGIDILNNMKLNQKDVGVNSMVAAAIMSNDQNFFLVRKSDNQALIKKLEKMLIDSKDPFTKVMIEDQIGMAKNKIVTAEKSLALLNNKNTI